MKINFLPILVVFCCAIGIRAQQSFDVRTVEKKIFDDIFNTNGYDSQFRPYGTNNSLIAGGPMKLRVQLYVRSIFQVDDKKNQYTVQLTVRQRWWDDRLLYNSHDGKIKFIKFPPSKIWTPDLFFANEVESEDHELLAPNDLVRVTPNGDVLFSKRVTVRLSCKMNFRNFPFDFQKCSIIMPSYGHTMDDMIVLWEKADPIQISKKLPTLQFTLESFATSNCDSKTSTGIFSCLKAKFLFKRSYSYYQIQIYIPSSMLVILSWLSLWIDRELVVARLLLALMTLLTMATQVANFNTTVPSVNYTKALDVWTGMCLTFSFSALIEFIIVHHLSKRRKAAKLTVNNTEDDQTEDFKSSKNRCCFNVWPLISTPAGLDIVARIAYPIFFIMFNVIYWPTYAFSSSTAVDAFNSDNLAMQPIQNPNH